MIDELNPPRIDVLKIDAEGAEFQILDGIRDSHWPLIRQVAMEVHSGREGMERAIQVLESRGFRAHGRQRFAQGSFLSIVTGIRDGTVSA